jgi:hypothetical protein
MNMLRETSGRESKDDDEKKSEKKSSKSKTQPREPARRLMLSKMSGRAEATKQPDDTNEEKVTKPK